MAGPTRRVRRLASTALLLGLAACGPSSSSPNLADPALATFDGGGLTFNYPAAWRQFRHDEVSSFSSLIVDLGTVDIPDPCVTTPNDLGGSTTECRDRFVLVPDSLVVHVSTNGFPGFDIVGSRPPQAVPIVVAGRQAFIEQGPPEDAAVGADLVVTWTIDRPEARGNSYSISALVRGPDTALIRAQLQQLIQSLRFHAG